MEKYDDDVKRADLSNYDFRKIRKEELGQTYEIIKLLETEKFLREVNHYLCRRKSDGLYATVVENKVTEFGSFICALADEYGWRTSKPGFTEILRGKPMVGYIDSFRTDDTIYIVIGYNSDYYGKI